MSAVGQRFGRLVVVYEESRNGGARWECDCDCGGIWVGQANYVRSGNTASCGCLRRVGSNRGASQHPLYLVWKQMRYRCTVPSNPSYPNYGGRGIQICPRWAEDFWSFVADMGERPDGHSLDRIDNDGDYAPGNCRWADRGTQARNQRPRVRNTEVDVLKARIAELEWELAAQNAFPPVGPGDTW